MGNRLWCHQQWSSRKIFDIKHRPDSKSFVILVKDIDAIQEYADMPSSAMLDYALNSIKPVTFVLKTPKTLPFYYFRRRHSSYSDSKRWVLWRFCWHCMANFIVSTSTNISGQPTPRPYTEIQSAIQINGLYCSFSSRWYRTIIEFNDYQYGSQWRY